MKIVYVDPLYELKQVLERAAKEQKVSHVAVSREEMKIFVTHLSMGQVFPDYANERAVQSQQHGERLKKVQSKLNGNMITEVERQALFDQQFGLQTAIDDLNNKVPAELRAFNGVIVRVSLKA